MGTGVSKRSIDSRVRLRLVVRGLVQGIGFRPFVHRLATELGLSGSVCNSASGARIEVEGAVSGVERFRQRLGVECPVPGIILHREETWLDAEGREGFEIVASDLGGDRTALVLPDLATCPECVAEIFDPRARRHRYPFTNCTRCGPRYSIIESMPYDRERTSMRAFGLCGACRGEFEDPGDRRFHAQPIACPECGPRLRWLAAEGADGGVVGEEALGEAVRVVREGGIVALKGLGGYQLVVRADAEEAVGRLRERKQREAKPLAVMVGSLEEAERHATLTEEDRRLLVSPVAPIVLVPRRGNAGMGLSPRIVEAVAPGCPWLGVMLPYTPLHHLLLSELRVPLVVTSGNRSDEPICLDEAEAVERLGGIADGFLVHDRRVVRQVDDSVVRTIGGREQVLRRARGYAPLPLALPGGLTACTPVLAVGAHWKNSVALARGGEVFASQHIGDLETEAAVAAFGRVVRDLPRLLEAPASWIAADPHPDYTATQYAESAGLPVVYVPHHEAHAWACLADNQLEPPVLALSWDGAGLGPDGTIWGGEFLELREGTWDCRRRGWLRPFRLPGGDAAARDARRSWVGLRFEGGAGAEPDFEAEWGGATEAAEVRRWWEVVRRGVHAPWTSSMGRLFDGVAAGLGLAGRVRFEGEAAMCLEWAAWRACPDGVVPESVFSALPALSAFGVEAVAEGWRLDWAPWIAGLRALAPGWGGEADRLALAFHGALVGGAVEVVERVGVEKVLLTGGCFQNRLLTEWLTRALQARGFSVYSHQRIPPNDAGLAVGQAVAATVRVRRGKGE